MAAGDTVDTETGQILTLKRCLCHIACVITNVSISAFSTIVRSLIYSDVMGWNDFLHADGGIFLRPAT
jgi:hypothetical protein